MHRPSNGHATPRRLGARPRHRLAVAVATSVVLAAAGAGVGSPAVAAAHTPGVVHVTSTAAVATAAPGSADVTVDVGGNVEAVAVDPALHLAYVVREQQVRGKEFPAAILVEVDVRTHRVVRRLVVGHDTVSGVAVDPRTHRIYVLLGGYDNGDPGPEGVQVVSGPKGRVIAHIDPGSGAVAMAVAPGRRRGWVATTRGGVGIVDLATSKPIGRYAVTASPVAIAWDPATGHVVSVANSGTRRIATIATPAGHVVAGVAVGTGSAYPFGADAVAVDPARHAAFFGNSDSGRVSQLDLRTHRVVRRFAIGSSNVASLSVDSHAGLVFVTGDLYDASRGFPLTVFSERTGRIIGRIALAGTAALLANDPVDRIEVAVTAAGRAHLLTVTG